MSDYRDKQVYLQHAIYLNSRKIERLCQESNYLLRQKEHLKLFTHARLSINTIYWHGKTQKKIKIIVKQQFVIKNNNLATIGMIRTAISQEINQLVLQTQRYMQELQDVHIISKGLENK